MAGTSARTFRHGGTHASGTAVALRARRRGPSPLRMLVATLAAALSLAACSAGGGAQTSSGASAGGGEGGSVGANRSESANGTASGKSTSGIGDAARLVPALGAQIRTAATTIRVDDVPAAVRAAEDLTVRRAGVVAAVRTDVAPDAPDHSSAELTLRVPNEDFTDFLRDLARLGKQLSLEESTEDVSVEVADVAARISSQRESLERLRSLVRRANSVEDIVRIESDLAQRQADLEALQARQRTLADKTALSTVRVSFVTTPKAAPVVRDDRGFLAGLRGGWDAFLAATAVALTILGAVLPFALTVALVAVPTYLVLRARRRATARASTPQAAS